VGDREFGEREFCSALVTHALPEAVPGAQRGRGSESRYGTAFVFFVSLLFLSDWNTSDRSDALRVREWETEREPGLYVVAHGANESAWVQSSSGPKLPG
jgi:hypothetical protein